MDSKRTVQVNRYGFKRVEIMHNGLGQIYIKSKHFDGSLWLPEGTEWFTRRDKLRGHSFSSPDLIYTIQEEIDAQNVLRGIS